MSSSHQDAQAQGELIHPDCLDATDEFTARLNQLIAEAKEAGLTDEEIHEKLSEVKADEEVRWEIDYTNPNGARETVTFHGSWVVDWFERDFPGEVHSIQSIGNGESEHTDVTPEHINATGLIYNAEEGMEIEIEYDSSYGDGTETVSGVVTCVDRGLWVRFQTEGGRIEVFGSELSNRENGEVKDATRRIGYLTDYTLTEPEENHE